MWLRYRNQPNKSINDAEIALVQEPQLIAPHLLVMHRPKRARRNMHLNRQSSEEEDEVSGLQSQSQSRAPSPESDTDLQLEDAQFPDSLKTNVAHLYDSDCSDFGPDSEVSEQEEWEELNDSDFEKSMNQMDDDLHDPNWIPDRLRRKAEARARKTTGEFIK